MSVELSTLGTIIHVNKDGKDIFTYDYLELYNLWHNGFGYESEEDADEETEPCVDCEAHILGNELFIYGRLDCKSAARYIAEGKYIRFRVFFKDERLRLQRDIVHAVYV